MSQATKREGGEPSRRSTLKSFYGMNDKVENGNGVASVADPKPDPFDINSQGFMAEAYMSKLIKEKSLTELMDKESEMERHIKTLDSDMQTLVYENYNKFISATETVRKMKNDFKKMEDEMDELTSNMAAIMDLSDKISGTLQGRRQQITKLAGVHTLLKKLQFLFELPARLQKCIEMEAYSSAVRYYVKARKVLYQYQHEPSFAAIQHDCQKIIQELIAKLRLQFHQKESSARKLAECVDLLLQLNEPPEELCDEFLSHANQKLDDNLAELDKQCQLLSDRSPVDSSDVMLRRQRMDILEFVDCGCNGFISNMCLVIASYNDMFINRHLNYEQLDAIATKKLVQFVHELMKVYFQHMERRVDLETESGDNMMFVRALDRFHRRLQAMNKILPDTDFSRAGTDIVARAARDRSIHYRRALERHFADSLTDVRQSLATPKPAVGGKSDSGGLLHELLQSLQTSVVEQVKSVLVSLQAFVSPDMTFAMKPYFRNQFTMRDVREGVIVTFIRHIVQVCNGFCESGGGEKTSYPPGLLLILCRFCLELDKSIIGYMLMLADEQFLFDTRSASANLTSSTDLTAEARAMGQRLLNHYVRLQGGNISQMLRKSVETRDWLNTIEPRSVRAVMKRVIEDVTAIDSQVAQLFEEGVRKERSSDSTKRSHGGSRIPRTTRSITTSAMSASNLMNNIQKLFSEKIEIFSAVDFNKVSVLTGIIKIGLKTFVECVRVRTFGRYGLQQIQVDTHYLQLYLWRFVNDENLVHVLIDEIVGSTIHRCVDPVTMETSVVDLICERG